MHTDLQDRIHGCLTGGAIGDALGAPVEFWDRAEIEATFGPDGVRDYHPVAFEGAPQRGLVTDDTQMTLFTCEGLMRGHMRGMTRGICDPTAVVYYAYQRWLKTQEGGGPPRVDPEGMDSDNHGWLIREPWLHARRAPGNTCLTALAAVRDEVYRGPTENDSKGCGGVMRSAPFGLYSPLGDAIGAAVECAAITHGHPTGQLASAAFAVMVQALSTGRSLDTALDAALQWLKGKKGNQETVAALRAARRAAEKEPRTWQTVESLGGGWVAEEALAIGVYCALVHPGEDEMRDALSLAVSHSGDSDSTGSICGNLLGTLHGIAALPHDLHRAVEGRDTIARVAYDMAFFIQTPEKVIEDPNFDPIPAREWWDRYPGC